MITRIERRAVLHAVAEAARTGPDRFVRRYGFRPGTRDVLDVGGLQLPPKAVLAVAHRYQHGDRPLRAHEFSGGLEHAARVLVRLGFRVRRGDQWLTPADVELPDRLSLRPRSAPLRLYVCRPTNARSVAACYEHDFGTLISPLSGRTLPCGGQGITDLSAHTAPLDGLPYGIDNGVWSCHVAGAPWRGRPFLRLLDRIGAGASFAVLPDIVGGGEESLAFSLDWWRRNKGGVAGDVSHWLLAVQDGMTADQVRAAVLEHGFAGVFVGGTTRWKWASLHEWAALGLDLGLRVHVGRVNGERRAALCRDLGVTSIDGSSVTRFAKNAPKMGRSCDGTETLPDPRPARHACATRRFEITLGAPP